MQVHVHYKFQKCISSMCMFYRKKRQHDILRQIIRIIGLDYSRILTATTFTVDKIWALLFIVYMYKHTLTHTDECCGLIGLQC